MQSESRGSADQMKAGNDLLYIAIVTGSHGREGRPQHSISSISRSMSPPSSMSICLFEAGLASLFYPLTFYWCIAMPMPFSRFEVGCDSEAWFCKVSISCTCKSGELLAWPGLELRDPPPPALDWVTSGRLGDEFMKSLKFSPTIESPPPPFGRL